MPDPIGAVVPFGPMMRVPIARILVIDDNPAVVDLLVTCLREQGYGVLGALTSEDGLRLITLSHPDLVLLDLTLPGMNGIEVLKRIRSIDPTIGVIMVTASTDPLVAREALQLGARAYVDKPFDLAYLNRVVAMALRPVTQRPDDQPMT